jgi:hypothetical protein
VIDPAYRDLLTTIAEAAATLTGLLFVAISVAPSRRSAQDHSAVKEVRAAASLLTFTNALTVALFGLVPDANIGYPATVVGVVGLFFVAASPRTLVATKAADSKRGRQVEFIALLLALFGSELATGITLLVSPDRPGPLELLGNLLVASMLIGVARAWELVGDRDTGIVASIGVLTGRRPAILPGETPPAATTLSSAGDTAGPTTSADTAVQRPAGE